MAFCINEIELLGNVGNTEALPNGVFKFSLATTEGGYKNRDGKEVPEKTEWHNIVTFGKEATLAEKHISKGDRVLLKGRLTYSEYTDKNGAKRTNTSIKCREFYIMQRVDKKGETSPQGIENPYLTNNDSIPF